MYDPRIGQWISEDPIGFEAGDANLRRYVHNAPTMFTDPTGLQERDETGEEKNPGHTANGPPSDKADQQTIVVKFVVIVMTTKRRLDSLSDEIIEKANDVFDQCDVTLSKRGMIFPGDPFVSEKRITRIVFDVRTSAFVAETGESVPLNEFLPELLDKPGPNGRPPRRQKDTVYLILVDEITGFSARTFGLAFSPLDESIDRKHHSVILAVDPPKSKTNDDPGRTLAHECANYFGVKDRDRSGADGENLMSYGKWEGTILIRGTKLDEAQIRQLREGIRKVLEPDKKAKQVPVSP